MFQILIQYTVFIILIMTPFWMIGEMFKAWVHYQVYKLAKPEQVDLTKATKTHRISIEELHNNKFA